VTLLTNEKYTANVYMIYLVSDVAEVQSELFRHIFYW